MLTLLMVVVATVIFATNFGSRDGDGSMRLQMAMRTDLTTLEMAIDAFEIDTGRLPSNSEGLSALLAAPSNTPGWKGPYVKSIPLDPWGHPYLYVLPSVKSPARYDLSCAGPDGIPGTKDDFGNW